MSKTSQEMRYNGEKPSYLLCVAIIGYHEQRKKPRLEASYPEFELSDLALNSIYSMSSFSGDEPGFVSLEVDEGVVMSYYTGNLEPMRCKPHCLVLFLDKPDNPERYRRILTKMGSVVFPLLCDRDFADFVRKLFEAAAVTGEIQLKRSFGT